MASTKLMQEIENVLQQFEGKYFVGDKVNKARVIEDIDNYDVDLMSAMLDNEKIKNNFTTKIEEHTVFRTNQFIEVFQADEYWEDSYTKYSKKIGLASNGNFLDEASETVLDFPYKDTVLKASMSKEDTDKEDLKPDEPFLNEVIAREEIDVLLDKKILKNAKKYTADGKEEVSDFSDEDNLILKGNNLLGLHTIAKRYRNKIKMITIDPPYYFLKNKSSDSFKYNSNFKLSTWLTFMKNRLEIAKELLSNDGIISIIIGEDGYAHLKLLCDDIFGAKNYVTTISWRKTDNQSNIGEFANVKDYIILYKKHDAAKLGNLPLSKKAIKEYQYEDKQGKYSRGILKDEVRGRHNYEVTTPNGMKVAGPWMIDNEEFNKLQRNNLIHWPINGNVPRRKIYLKDAMEKGQITSDFWNSSYGTNQRGATEMKELFGSRIFDFPKPERLLMNLISIGSEKDDIVLDFFMGSSTTQAVAHKMGRQYIGIEQMDYISTISVPRLQKVIKGDQGGISEDVDWQGGGSFVYAELMEKNRGYLTDVMDASDQESLRQTFNLMLENADFDFRVDLEEVEDSLNTLSLEDQKRVLVKILDKNQLYYNYSEIDDENVRDLISDNDYEFNKNFYKEDNDE